MSSREQAGTDKLATGKTREDRAEVNETLSQQYFERWGLLAPPSKQISGRYICFS